MGSTVIADATDVDHPFSPPGFILLPLHNVNILVFVCTHAYRVTGIYTTICNIDYMIIYVIIDMSEAEQKIDVYLKSD